MPTHSHAVIWLDHLQARIFFIGLSGTNEVVLHSHLPTQHIHHKANSIGSGHVHDDEKFFGQIADAIRDCGQILILGPSGEKTALHAYLGKHDPQVAKRVVAVESADHPTDAQVIAHAKRVFQFDQPPRV